MWELKWSQNKTAIPLKVTDAIQQKISSNINKLTQKEIEKMSEEMPENKKKPFCFSKPLFRLTVKKTVHVVSTLKTG